MAASVILYTPGSGGKAHGESVTIGANTGDFPYVLLAEPQRASYLVTTYGTAISTATAASHLLQIMAGASLNVRIRRIEMFQLAMATTAAMMDVQIIRLNTAGTSLGATYAVPALNTGDPAAGATAGSIPGAKGTEGNIMWSGTAYLMQTIGASTPLAGPSMVVDFDQLRTEPLSIAAGTGNGICIKNVTGHAAATVRFNVWLTETNF